MKNITVTVDDELYRQARVTASEKGTTVTAMVRSFLVEQVRERGVDSRYLKRNRALDRAFALIDDCEYQFGVADAVSREDLYDRR
jgi:antitoxin component of RelBE/YafQ-DinJ toxin-antitoxin module